MRKALSCLPLLLAAHAGAALAQGDSVNLQNGGLGLAMQVTTAQPAPSGVAPPSAVITSQADLTTQFSALQTRIGVGLETGSNPATASTVSGWWNRSAYHMGATWAPTSITILDVNASNSLRLEFDPADPVFAAADQHYSQLRQTDASASATVTPLPPLSLKVGASASSTAAQDITGATPAAADLLQTQARRMFTQAQWKLLPELSLDGGGKVEATGVYWSGARAGSFASLDPSLGASVTPWQGAAWRFSMEGAAAPLSTDQFVGYAAVGVTPATTASPATLTLQPNREWRYKAAFEQKAGSLDLTASVLEARLETYAYVAPYGQNAGRVDMGAGQRREVQAGLAAPLPLFGLSPLTVKASGAWRASQAQDPLTGLVGRLSGESPYDASLSISQALWGSNLRWGMTAQATGPARTFFASQITALSATAGLGGFVEYRPGPVTVQLQMRNLVGGDRDQRDVYYQGPRALSPVDHADALRLADRVIRISLIRPL